MIVCVDCKKEITCEENGLGVRFGTSHVYTGDKYKCTECGIEIILTNKDAIYDPEKKEKTIQMDEN